jgi:hypothetical protein
VQQLGGLALRPAQVGSLAAELGHVIADGTFQAAHRALGLAATTPRGGWPACVELVKSVQAADVFDLDAIGGRGT